MPELNALSTYQERAEVRRIAAETKAARAAAQAEAVLAELEASRIREIKAARQELQPNAGYYQAPRDVTDIVTDDAAGLP